MKGIKVGVKIVDECHLNFSANNLIDIQSDVAHNLYLSATYLRSSKNSRAIFRRIYPDDIKFNGNDYNKYVNITECRYSLGPIDVRHVQTNRGWSQYKYEKFLLRSPKKMADFLDRVLHPVVEQYYIEKRRRGQKLLVLVGLTELAEFLTQWFRSMYPDLVSTAYIYGTEEAMVLESDIIVSTVGSAGTGKDIKGLRSMILFTSFSSESLTLQTIGRLRKMEDTPEFVYMVNTALDHTKRHADIRRPIYRHIAASFGVIEV
jgi:superfamily II DNA or RNA helicase